ncbi:hypothetical protein ACHAXM_010834 [Skeletonema potamos]
MVKTVKLISKEGDAFEIPISCCRLSEVIDCELECHSSDEDKPNNDEQDENDSCVTLSLTASRIHSPALRKVADFLMHFEVEEMTSFEPPFTSENIEEIVQKWFADFITEGVDHSLLLDIISAANFLSIQPLLKLSVLALSININGKSPDILRPMFGISNNLDDPEQKARVMKENEWEIEARRQFDEDQKTKII